MEGLPWILLFAGLGVAVGYAVARAKASVERAAQDMEGVAEEADLYALVVSLEDYFGAIPHASVLLDHPQFEQGVEMLCDESTTVEELLSHYTGNSAVLACMALEALARREDRDVREEVIAGLNDYVPWTRFFALRALDARSAPDEALVGRVLGRIDDSWDAPITIRILREFLEKRRGGGEAISMGSQLENLTEERANTLSEILGPMPRAAVGPLLEEVSRWRSKSIDLPFLRSIGRVWESLADVPESPTIAHEAFSETVAKVESALRASPRRSVLLVGEHGVGKSCLARSAAARLVDKGWVVFEAGHAELIAGMTYIGELEGRMRKLIERIADRPILWLVEEFHMLALAGRHRYGPLSVLDYLLPQLEGGKAALLGETRPGAYERLAQIKPRILTALETVRVSPLSEKATLDLVDRWSEISSTGKVEILSAETRREAWMLAQQYVGDRSTPGNVLDLLDLTRQRLSVAGTDAPKSIRTDDLITTLGQITGLPASILDERQDLDLAALRRLFETHVMGQAEAVDCLVERVAMIKAGVTDPTRPFGVFLFAGPTGTGKTEIAKTLTKFLFGSPERMIRLDMSEFQIPEALNRIMETSEDGPLTAEQREGSLVARIRKQPFSVVLLDEFEKAHPSVWDVFLQVFDDGRLTDRMGNTADFRHAIVIMTSNLGGLLPAGAGLGFIDGAGGFSPRTVLRDIDRSFRKEFLNRIDRVVVFKPLGRETMRDILRKELAEAFHRRGFRSRTWAVEWDEGAIEFLLTRGFTANLGARPLRRAIEQHLLAPLATTIVNHQYPEGDQFLFVRADGERLVVEFVDPDAPEATGAGAEEAPRAPVAGERLRLERIALEATGTATEIGALDAAYERVKQTVEEESWQEAKQSRLEHTRDPEFWGSPERFAVLGQFEYLDRIEAGLRSAGSLLERLKRRRDRYPRDLVRRLGQQLYLLESACRGVREERPRDAFLLVEAWTDSGVTSVVANDFARRIGGMYQGWAEKRRMQCGAIEETDGEGERPYRLLLAVSGYAAYTILSSEEGLHVLELPEGERGTYRRVAARVRVCPQPEGPPGGKLIEQAREGMAAREASPAIVRRYRERPSPLVRDTVRGWRTGKLDQVLSGQFDLLGAVVEQGAAGPE